MNAKNSVFVICVEAIIYLLLQNLHDCTFNFYVKEAGFFNILSETSENMFHDCFPMKFVFTYNISLMWCEINSKH